MISLLLSKNQIHRLNRRQRKKLRVGEFQELGFSLRRTNRLDLDDVKLNAHFEDFIGMIEARGLLFGGAFSASGGDGFVATNGRRSTTVEDRDSVVIGLRNRAEVSTVDADEFVDNCYGWDE